MNKIARNLIIGFTVIILGALCVWKAYDFGSNDLLGIIENKTVEAKTSEEQASENTEQPSTTTPSGAEIKTEEDILNAMHAMANTLIVPVDGQIWGTEKITKEKLSELINIVTNSSSSHKEELLAILNRWNSGDFNNAVEDHNKVWKLLGGTIGKASDINEEGVKETLAIFNGN